MRSETLPVFYGANGFRIELSHTDDLVRAAAITGRVNGWLEAVREHHDLFRTVVIAHGWSPPVRRRLLGWEEMGFRAGVVKEEEYVDDLDALLMVTLD